MVGPFLYTIRAPQGAPMASTQVRHFAVSAPPQQLCNAVSTLVFIAYLLLFRCIPTCALSYLFACLLTCVTAVNPVLCYVNIAVRLWILSRLQTCMQVHCKQRFLCMFLLVFLCNGCLQGSSGCYSVVACVTVLFSWCSG